MIKMNTEKIFTYEQLYQRIVQGGYNYGTGSWSYLNSKIEMKLDDYGEYVPIVKSKDSLSQKELNDLISKTINLSKFDETEIASNLFASIPNIQYNNRIGYYSNLYVGHAIEGNFRENGSSGGMCSWLFKELIEREEIDKVIEVKESKTNGKLFQYGISANIEDVICSAKTKYYPVEFSRVLKFVKKNPGRYAIIGLPSFITSLRLLQKDDPILKTRIKFLIGLVCGHQKTTKFADFLAWQCGIEPSKIDYINFRKKLRNSSANSYGVEVRGSVEGKNKTVIKPMKELMGGNWGEGFFKVNASDFTDDVMNETADVTFGDAWLPEYTSDSLGNNIIVIRNPYIKKIIDDGIEKKKIKVDLVSADTIYRSQSSHYRHTQDELSYRLYKKDKHDEWRPKKRIEPSNDISFLRRRIQDQRETIMKKSKIYYKVAEEKKDLAYFFRKMTRLERIYSLLYKLQGAERRFSNFLK